MSSAVERWLDRVRLRAVDEAGKTIPRAAGARGSGRTVRVGGDARCYVSVSRRTQASPGAACLRYHDRPGVEVLREQDIETWRGDRYSVILSPERGTDLIALADRFLEELERRFGPLRGSAWLHHAGPGQAREHLHVAIDAQGGRILLTRRTVEKAADRAMRMLARQRARGAGAGAGL